VTSLLVAVPSASSAATSAHCGVWKQTKIAYSLGILESLLPDNRGGMLLSSTTHNAVERLTPNGHVAVVAKAPSPGQLVWRGKRVMLPTGDALQSGALSTKDGTLQLLNLRSHKLKTYATGLTMPNGLALDRDGTAYVTRDTGGGTGITRISAKPGHKVTPNWSSLPDTNGIAIDTKHRVMYVDQTFSLDAPIERIPMAHPARATEIGNLIGQGGLTPKLLDDLTMGPDGVLYLPANLGGDLFSFDPRTKQSCLIAKGLGNPSDVTIGTGHGWRKGALFVCGFDGTVREFVRQ
jgi:sugar lactone lactonase YvrE